MITKATLKGHTASVLCLDVSSPSQSSLSLSSSQLLLSGSEDGTARLWDLREHKRRACLCIKVSGGGDVLSAVFAPPPPSYLSPPVATTPIPNENANFARDCTVFLGVENTVLEYDLRNANAPIVFLEPTNDWSRVLQNQDEVNQIGLTYYNKSNNNNNNTSKKKKNQKKKGGGGANKKRQQSCDEDSGGSLYLAACDDAGKVRWTEASSFDQSNNNNNSSTILHHDIHGVAVVPACAFRPNNNNGVGLELASGGTDCKIQLWDIVRPKKPISTFAINQNNNADDKSKPQICNPPFVYSLAWSNDGKSLAAGLGNGTVGVFEINNRALVQSQLLVGHEEGDDGTMYYAHESSVASVVFPSFSASTNDRILCSAGSDGSIVFWDLGKPNDEQWDDDNENTKAKSNNDDNDRSDSDDDVVAQLFPPILLQGLRNDDSDINNVLANTARNRHKPSIIFDISHAQKINWVTPAAPSSSNTASSEYNNTIFVADTSPDITSYTIPF